MDERLIFIFYDKNNYHQLVINYLTSQLGEPKRKENRSSLSEPKCNISLRKCWVNNYFVSNALLYQTYKYSTWLENVKKQIEM